MSTFLIIAVNYNAYHYIDQFLSSIDTAAAHVSNMRVTVAIADNSVEPIQKISTNYPHIKVLVYAFHQNYGYLGGALRIYNEIQQDYNYVAISNIDLTLNEDFFSQLSLLDTQHIGWIAPDIYTPRTQTHENPNITTRPSKAKFLVWLTIYSFPLLYKLYHFLYQLRHNTPIHTTSSNIIYCGHGSFMLFTSLFTQHFPQLSYPCFMYGEEIFIGELMRQANLPVLYCPNLHIINIGKASVSALPSKQVFNWSKQSLKYIYTHFFMHQPIQ